MTSEQDACACEVNAEDLVDYDPQEAHVRLAGVLRRLDTEKKIHFLYEFVHNAETTPSAFYVVLETQLKSSITSSKVVDSLKAKMVKRMASDEKKNFLIGESLRIGNNVYFIYCVTVTNPAGPTVLLRLSIFKIEDISNIFSRTTCLL